MSEQQSHDSYLSKALERIQQSDGFVLISIEKNEVNICASITSAQDALVGFGINKFIEQREQAMQALAVPMAANEVMH